MNFPLLVLTLVFIHCASTFAADAPATRNVRSNDPQTERQRSPTHANVAYGTHERQVLDFYQATSDRPTPVVFHIHGGGWVAGDKRRVAGLETYLAAGISVVSINYRYTTQAQLAGVKPPVQWPLSDAARALQFVRSKAADWNLDKQRIGATGGSAGACSSLWLAFHDDLSDPESTDPVARESTRLWCAAVVGAQTSLDPLQLKEWTPNSRYGGHAFGFMPDPNDNKTRDTQFAEFLAARESVLPWIKQYSPIEHVTAGDPPVWLHYSAPPAIGEEQKDPTHTANYGVKLQEKCKAIGVACELVYPGAPGVRHATAQDYLIETLRAPAKSPSSKGLSAAPSAIVLPDSQSWPAVACTPAELERLRTAYRGKGDEHNVVARVAREADEALTRAIDFPPEGGQHNQWYQCDKCQIALRTIDDTHHQCPKCETTYSGYPYDNVIFSRKHSRLTSDMNACAWAYALDGNEKYARHAREILIGYAERYSKYPYHSAAMAKKTDKPSSSGGHVFEQTLNEASWMQPVCEAYDLIRRSSVLSADDHRAIRENFLMPVYRNIDKHRAGKSNWQTYHNSALMLIGGVLNDINLVRQAIEDPKNGFYYQMKVSVLPEGMWYENSWSYHFYTLGAVQRIVETARRLGIDLYRTPEVKAMYEVAMDYLMPDGTLPRFGDAVTARIPGDRYESAYHVWKDPAFLAVLPQGPTWDSILYGRTERPGERTRKLESTLKKGAGHAILRVHGDEGEAAAVLTFGPFGGFHGHFDKLSFVYFALGKEQGYDPGRARSQAYRLPVHRNWYRATTGHNTVLVDRKSQEGVEGRLDLFVANEALSAAAASVDTAYEGVQHHRLLVLRPGFLVVTDMLRAADGRAHTFDWMYHNRGRKVSSPQTQPVDKAPAGQGFEYIADVRQGVTDETARAMIENSGDLIHVLLNRDPGSEVMIGTGVGESVLDRVPLVFVTRTGSSARFAAAVDPTPGNGSPDIKDVELSGGKGDAYIIRVILTNGGVETYAYDPDRSSRDVLGRRTTAKFLCLAQSPDGEVKIIGSVD